MKKIIQKESVVCDCCETPLHRRDAFLNDGSYQGDYVDYGDVQICFSCMGKLFDINVKTKVPEDKVKEWVQTFRTKYSGGLGVPIQLMGDFDLHRVEINELKTTGVNETLQTNGIEMGTYPTALDDVALTNDLHNSLEVKPKTMSQLDEIKSLEEL